MRRSIRFSIAGLMGVVLVAAIGLAALRDATETWAGAMLLVTCGILALAVVGVVCRTESERAWWLGFALFGWGYLALAFWSWDNDRSPRLPTLVWLDTLGTKLGLPARAVGGGMGGMGGGMRSTGIFPFGGIWGTFGGFGGNAGGVGADGSFAQVGHCLWALLFAILGGILARFLFAIPPSCSQTRPTDSDRAAPPSRKRFARPAVVGIVGFMLLASLLAMRSKPAPGLWAGATFLVTCGLLGLTALGAVLDRGRRGDIWLGATLFGAGYMILAFSRDPVPNPWPHLPTDQFLSALKPWLPRAAEGFFVSSEDIAAANARILKALDQPVPMHFPEETPLEDVVKHIAEATNGADGKVVPIYLDPIGLQEADKTPQSVVHLDFDGVPLKTTLTLCLKQLDLAYCIRDGVLVISFVENASPMYEDPFLISGHCLFALFAAALGGALAPLVSDWRRESR